MFGKRRRAASNPPQRAAPPPTASAAVAASKAFIKNAESNGDLSSAAAAAALRTHVRTPTPVGDTVTKRMVRRGSLSSTGSFSRPQPGPLRRQSSSGSMAERSFRAPSPGRGSPADTNAPPVPPVPKSIKQESVVHRRASSLEPSYRGGSPAPRSGGRGVSLDRGASSRGRGQRPATSSSNLALVSEEDDPSRSVNFSRPISPGTTQKPSPPSSHGWYGGPVVNQDAVQHMASTSRPKTSSGVSAYDLQMAQRSVQNAAERPVRTHQVSQGVQGSRLSSGSMRAKPSGTAVQSQSYLPARRQSPRPVDPNSSDAVYDPSTRTFIHKQDAMARFRDLHDEPAQPAQPPRQYVDDYYPHHVPQKYTARRSPSPIPQYVQREDPPARLDTTTRRSEPVERPAAPRTPEPYVNAAMERRHHEHFADADIQAQEQVGTSHKLEDSGYGTIVGREDELSPTFATNQDSSYPRVPTPVISTPTNTLAGHGRGSVRVAHDRNASLSPPRNAHFAPVAVEFMSTKHVPLPRSVSPAKSALKSSPSVSRRGESPVAPNGRFHSKSAASETSDTPSDDGGRKKKRSVRVSFEETPSIAGAADHVDTETHSPQTGHAAPKWSPITEKEDEFEDFMKPRPALPSFGSIRDKQRRAPEEDMAEKVTETVSANSGTEPQHASSDNALGNIVAQDFAEKQVPSSNPLPPQVTTVEGTGSVSDSSEYSNTQKHEEPMETSQSQPAPEPKSLSTPLDGASSAPIPKRVVEVPDIALQPATPSPLERPEPKYQSMVVPGGWAEDFIEAENQPVNPTTTSASIEPSASQAKPTYQQSQPIPQAEDDETTDDNSSVYSDAYEDISDGEGGFGSIDALMTKPVAPSTSGLTYSQHEAKRVTADDSTDSDATATQAWNAAQSHWSGLRGSLMQPRQTESAATEPAAERLSHAQEVAARVMQAPILHEKSAPFTEPEVTPDTTPERKITSIPPPRMSTPSATQPTTKPLKSALKKSQPSQPAPMTESQGRTTMRSAAPREAPPETHMKRTMRGGEVTASRSEPQMGSTMRSSMRGAPDTAPRAQPAMRTSMRTSDVSPAPNMGLAASRHSMIAIDSKPPRGALQKRNIPPGAAVSKPRPQSMSAAQQSAAEMFAAQQFAAPVPTYDSDSDASASSFQRSRGRGAKDKGGRYTMRGSMRQEPAPTMRANAPAPKQVRAISPPGSPSPAMRKSLRPSSPTQEPNRSSKFSIRSLSPMGRFRSNKDPFVRPTSPTQPKQKTKQPKQSKQKAPAAKAKAPFSSRFADSSDEDDDRQPRRFQSRFDDSDDEEPIDYKLPQGLAPVRGIPRRAGEEDGDSTDLEEEADDEKPQVAFASAAKAGQATNGSNGNAKQGAALSAGSLRDSKQLPSFESGSKAKKKRGFFGLGKKKNAAEPDSTEAQPNPVLPDPEEDDDIPMPPSQRNREMGLPLTPIDEDKDFGDPVLSKKSPKLQRRTTPEWPLPPVVGDEVRPMSADGVAPRRPRFAMRQGSNVSNTTAPIVDAQGRTVSYGRSGKKKKFQGLRRVFGLND